MSNTSPPGSPIATDQGRELQAQLLARRKARLLSQVTFGSILALLGGALGLLLVQGTELDPLLLLQPDQSSRNSFDWDAVGRSLPPIDPDRLPPVFGIASTWDNLVASLPGAPPTPEASPTPGATAPATTVAPNPSADAKRLAELKGYLDDGERLLRDRRFTDAEEAFIRATKINPELKGPLGEKFFNRAKEEEKRRSWSRALLLYKIALHFEYENPRYHLALAQTCQALGDSSKALEHKRLAEKFSGS